MVNDREAALDLAFSALADPTRRSILERLSRGGAQPTALAEPFDMSLPAISKHLGVLERAGLITRHKRGRARDCVIRPGPLEEATAWLERHRAFWERQLDSLGRYLDETRTKEVSPWQHQVRRRPSRSGSARRTRTRGSGSSRRGRMRGR